MIASNAGSQRVSLAAMLAFALLKSVARADDPFPNGVAAGDVTQTTAVLWTHYVGEPPLFITWSSDPELSVSPATLEFAASQEFVKAFLYDLLPGTQYYYRASSTAGEAWGTFRTAAPVGDTHGFRLGVSGDWRGELAPYPSIRNVPKHDLDLWVSLGDTIYADVPSPAVDKPQCDTYDDFVAKHNEVYSEHNGLNTLRALRESTAILAMIDDHEVTNDFAGGAPPASDPRFAGPNVPFINQTALFQLGVEVFSQFNPISDEIWDGTGDARVDGQRKLYRYRTYGSDAAIFLTDARSFRDAEVPISGGLFPDDLNAYEAATFDPARTMLGKPQLAQLQHDLLEAQAAGITWKFVLVGEPVQNLGPIYSSDRFEGYAAERTELLKFIADNQLTNVVFISADIHGTLVNNLTYQESPGSKNIPLDAWEISTGSVAYDAPFGGTIFRYAGELNFLTGIIGATYAALPTCAQDGLDLSLGNLLLGYFGYDAIGLQHSNIPARLLKGGYVAVNSYGWTEFDIDRTSQQLRVTTYAITPYTAAQLGRNPKPILRRQPSIISRFSVNPR